MLVFDLDALTFLDVFGLLFFRHDASWFLVQREFSLTAKDAKDAKEDVDSQTTLECEGEFRMRILRSDAPGWFIGVSRRV
jgi:hypothetical protein